MQHKERTLMGIILFPLIILSLLFSSCVKNSNLTPHQQTQVNLYTALSSVASTNLAVTKTAVALNSNKTISDETTRAILGYTSQVSTATRSALEVLDSTKTPAEKAQAVLGLMGKLDLPPPVKKFISDGSANSALSSVISSITLIQQSILRVVTTPPVLLDTTKGVQ